MRYTKRTFGERTMDRYLTLSPDLFAGCDARYSLCRGTRISGELHMAAIPGTKRVGIRVSILALGAVLIAFGLLRASGGTADHVGGQPDLTHAGQNRVDGRGMLYASGVAVD